MGMNNEVISAAGPLMVSGANPRYFTVARGDAADRKAVYLTGSHIYSNFHDGMGPGLECPEIPERMDYEEYLTFLKDHGHNFIRLWRWEQFQSQAPVGESHFCMTPQPWARTGPGTAKDGKPKFDLSRLDQSYFDRLRERVVSAGNEGIYVAVMLFEGFGLRMTPAPDNIEGHPFHAASNVNGVGIASGADYQALPLDPDVQALQAAYIRKVVDTVHDLPNVLYEVANEASGDGELPGELIEAVGLSESAELADSTEWQYRVIDLVKRYEEQMGYDKHPIGMTMQYPVADPSKTNEPLYNGPADWISPGGAASPFENQTYALPWYEDPPVNDGRKVVISDNDHYSPFEADALWAWKSFLRGHQPILMDFGIIEGVNPPDPSSGEMSYESFEPARLAMGDTLRFAERMKLIDMTPRGDLASTGYALVSLGQEYLVLQPSETAEPFTVELEAGTYAVEWHSLTTRETKEADTLTVESDESERFTAPFVEAGPAVLYLKQTGHR